MKEAGWKGLDKSMEIGVGLHSAGAVNLWLAPGRGLASQELRGAQYFLPLWARRAASAELLARLALGKGWKLSLQNLYNTAAQGTCCCIIGSPAGDDTERSSWHPEGPPLSPVAGASWGDFSRGGRVRLPALCPLEEVLEVAGAEQPVDFG